MAFEAAKPAGAKWRPGLKYPQICKCCSGWYDAAGDCAGCRLDARELIISWSPWLWTIMTMVHKLLQASYRERRGVVQLFTVPVAVGFALIRHFAKPNAKGAPYYSPAHASWKQGTSRNRKWHFIKFAYDCMKHVEWGFALHEYSHFYKTCSGPVRLVCGKTWQDVRVFGTPVQFKFKWAFQKTLGVPTPGVSTFSITANIGHVGMTHGAYRWNTEYQRWVAEQQLEQLTVVKDAVKAFPRRPLRLTHRLSGVPHPLREWSDLPTPMPVVQVARHATVSDDEEDDAEEDTDDADSDSTADGNEQSSHYS